VLGGWGVGRYAIYPSLTVGALIGRRAAGRYMIGRSLALAVRARECLERGDVRLLENVVHLNLPPEGVIHPPRDFVPQGHVVVHDEPLQRVLIAGHGEFKLLGSLYLVHAFPAHAVRVVVAARDVYARRRARS